jgi:Uma2 family endonuclease
MMCFEELRMTLALPSHVREEPPYRLTVDQYHRMIEQGILDEGQPAELLDGYLTFKIRSAAGEDPMTVGLRHAVCVKKIARLARRLEPLGFDMQTQQPVTLPPFDEPEPDGAIVIGRAESYTDHHPRATDLLCVIEVADESLHRDRGYKQQIYADSGIAQYVIANLQDNVVEVYTEPQKGKGRYGTAETLGLKDSIKFKLRGAKELRVNVRSVLP